MNYHCAKFYTNISTNMDTTNIFPFLAIYSQSFDYFTPKIAIFLPIQIGIIAYIVSHKHKNSVLKFSASLPLSRNTYENLRTEFLCFI